MGLKHGLVKLLKQEYFQSKSLKTTSKTVKRGIFSRQIRKKQAFFIAEKLTT